MTTNRHTAIPANMAANAAGFEAPLAQLDQALLNLVFDVKALAYGAVGDGAADDTTPINNAVTACKTAAHPGGTVLLPPGNYKISAAAIPLAPGSAALTYEFRGAGEGVTTITQSTAGQDVLLLGTTSAEACDKIHIHHLTLTGGRHGLRLNNVLHGLFERITCASGTGAGLYMEGQCESNHFRDMTLDSYVNGISTGNLNGGLAAGPLNLPEFQKCMFERIRVAHSTGTAMVLSGGILGGQQSSGFSTFRNIVLEDNKVDQIVASYLVHTVLEMISNEVTASNLTASNSYDVIRFGSGCAFCHVRDSAIACQSDSALQSFRYGINVVSGPVDITNCTMGLVGMAGTGDIYVGDTCTILNTVVSTNGGAPWITIAAPVAPRVAIIALRDSSGVLWPNFGLNIPAHLISSAGPVPTLGALQGGLTSQSIAGTDASHTITLLTTGAPPGNQAVIAIVTFAKPYATTPVVQTTQQNNTFGSSLVRFNVSAVSPTGYTLRAAGAAMDATSTFLIGVTVTD